MDTIDLKPNLRMLVLENPGQTYLVRRGDSVVVIDTGTVGQADLIAQGLADWGLGKEAVSHVLLTHWHPDHVGSAAELATWPNARIWASKADAPIIRGDAQGGFPHLSHTEEGFYAQAVGHVPDAPHTRVDRELTGNEELDEIGARVIATPGHTDGSIAFYFPAERALFTGDVATNQQGQTILGPFDVDRDEARASFRRLGDLDLDVVGFGHGSPLTGPATAALRNAAHADPIPDPLG